VTQAWEQIVMSGHAPNAISNRWTVEPLLAAGTAPEEITIEEAEEVMREADRRRAEWIGQDPDSYELLPRS
jgi:hypothetical protein